MRLRHDRALPQRKGRSATILCLPAAGGRKRLLPCQSIPDGALDRAIGKGLVATVIRQALEAALEVQAEFETCAAKTELERGRAAGTVASAEQQR